MKILYFLNCALLASALLASCENDVDENIVHLVNSGETDVVVTGVETEYGYPGEQFTIIGENFGGAKDFIKVSIGEKEAEIMSCSDQQIKAIIPEDATTGKIVVEFMDEIVSNSIQFRVMGNPEVLAMNPMFGETDPKCWGMPGGTITLYGNLLGGSEKDIEVLFGKTEAEIISWNENEIKIEIPEDVNDEDELTLNVGPIEEVNMPYSFMLVHPLTVEKTLPAEGYAGCEIEIVGTGLGNGEILEQTHVWFGEKAVTINKEESDDNSLIVTLPEGMETGEYAIKVRTPFEEKESTVVYNVIDEPTSFSSDESGYVGNEINISATGLPSGEQYVSILVGDKEAEILEYDTEDGTVKAKLPTDLDAGTYSLKFVYSGKELVNSNFELKAAPVVESYDAMVFSGGKMIIKGSNLNELTDKLTLTFDGTNISPISVLNESITFDVPRDITERKDVNVKLSYQDDIIAPVEFSVTVIPAADGDITEYVLENAGPDFKSDGNNVAGWIKGSVFNGNSLYVGEVNYLSFTGKANAWNASLYQNIILPRGTYQVEIVVAEDDDAGGRDGVVFAIMKGSDTTFPDLIDSGITPKEWHFQSKENVICEYNLTENHDTVVTTHTTEEFTIDESSPLTLGFALMLDNNNYLRISEIKIKIVE